MNPTGETALMKLIRFVHEKFKIAVLLVEHDMRNVMGICERIAVLDYGVKIAEGTPAGLAPSWSSRPISERRPTMLELRDLHVNYGAIAALHGTAARAGGPKKICVSTILMACLPCLCGK